MPLIPLFTGFQIDISISETIVVSENFNSLLDPLVINTFDVISVSELFIGPLPAFIVVGTRIFRNSIASNRTFIDTDT